MSKPSGSELPSVSIILLSYNGMPLIEDVLHALRRQKFPGNYELICIDSTSTDGTYEVCRNYCDRCIQISKNEFHHARTRNLGVAMATNGVCVFLSQDALPATDEWLARLIEPFLDPEVGAVYGRQEAPASFGPQRRFSLNEVYPETRQIRKFVDGTKKTLQQIRFSNANGAVRRQQLTEFPFPDFVLLSEDAAACYQVLQCGYAVVYEPSACVIHGHERTILEEFGWSFDVGVSLKRVGILDNPDFDSETRYGIKKMAAEMLHFASRGKIRATFLSASIYIARWLGIQLGKREARLPKWLLRSLSPTLRREYGRVK